MDKIINQIGEEAGVFITLRDLREKRKELEKQVPPLRENKFSKWKQDREAELKKEMVRVAQGPVQRAAADIASAWSPEKLLELTEKYFMMEQVKVMWPAVSLMYLPLVTEALETALYSQEKNKFDGRFQSIDAGIQRMTSMIPKPFSPEMINTDKRFPVERCGQDQNGRWYDRWLTDGLKSKPIFFDDQEKYIDALCRYYHEVYWATAEKEKAEKQAQTLKIEEAKVAPPPPANDGVSPSALREFYSIGAQPEPFSRRNRRLYKGGQE